MLLQKMKVRFVNEELAFIHLQRFDNAFGECNLAGDNGPPINSNVHVDESSVNIKSVQKSEEKYLILQIY